MNYDRFRNHNRPLTVLYRKVAEIHENPRNPRKHSRKQRRQIEASIRKFGFVAPILVDGSGMVIGGNACLRVAIEAGLEEVPCIVIDHLSEDDIRGLIIALNRHAENSDWDNSILAVELAEITKYFDDLDALGFTTPEMEAVFADAAKQLEFQLDPDIPPSGIKVIRRCHVGDIYELGRHRLICGDARDPLVIRMLLNGEKAEMVFTDRPYNVAIASNVSGRGRVKHQDFVMGAGEMTPEEFTTLLSDTLRNAASVSIDGSILFVFMDWRHMEELQEAAKLVGLQLLNLIVWAKDMPGLGSLYRSQHELVFVFKTGTGRHTNNIELGRHGRNRSNLWQYPAINSRKNGSRAELQLHPTAKPVTLVADAIKDVSKRNGIVLDLFGGSGSTLLAAEETGRRARICELDPHYCDVTLTRYEAATKDEAVLVACGWPRTTLTDGGDHE
jgi:DNA modification methylase